MKSLLKTIHEGLTYTDLAGHRQLRAYTVITGLILFLLLLVGGFSLFNRVLLMSKVQATPVAVSLTSENTPAIETVQPTPIQHIAADSVHCPTDSEEWSFSPPAG